MSIWLVTVILIGGLLILLASGLEIAVSIGIMAAIGLLLMSHQPLQQFIWDAFSTMNSFALTAVPLFVFMGTMLGYTGVLQKLFSGVDKWLGSLPGGLGMTVLGANAIFGAMSGSSIAATATFGSMTLPEMRRLGYSAKLSLGIIAAGGTLSVLIPPSIIMIIYGGWTGVSIARLFAGGMIPGIILALMFMFTLWLMIKLNPKLATKSPSHTWRERLLSVKELLPWVGMIVMVLGSIFLGIVTPTEGASLGAFLSIVFALAYRSFTFKAFRDSALAGVKISAMLAFIMLAASVLARVFQFTGFSDTVADLILGIPLGRYGILAIIFILYLVLGCFFDAASMLLLTMPFVIPIMGGLDLSLVWWGVVYTLLAQIGLVTPPFGLNLFTLQSVAPEHNIMTIAAGTMPFLIPALVLVVLLTAYPQLILWLPGVLYG